MTTVRVTKVLTETFCEYVIMQQGKKNQRQTGNIAPFFGRAAPFLTHYCELDPELVLAEPPGGYANIPKLTPAFVTDLLKKSSPWLWSVLGPAVYSNIIASPIRVIPCTIQTVEDIERAYCPEVRRALRILLAGVLPSSLSVSPERIGETIQAKTAEEVLEILRAHPTGMRQRVSICASQAAAREVQLKYCHEAVVDDGKSRYERDLIVIDAEAEAGSGLLGRVKCKVLIIINKT